MTETWRPVEGWPYEVSDLGRVRRAAAPGCGRVLKRRLRPRVGDQRAYVNLSKDATAKTFRVSHLVAAAFLGPRPDGLICLHENGDQLDDRAANLYWGTYVENAADRERHGRTVRGERHWKAKLTTSDVVAIRARGTNHRARVALATEFGVSLSQVQRIVGRKFWSHV